MARTRDELVAALSGVLLDEGVQLDGTAPPVCAHPNCSGHGGGEVWVDHVGELTYPLVRNLEVAGEVPSGLSVHAMGLVEDALKATDGLIMKNKKHNAELLAMSVVDAIFGIGWK